MVTIYSSGSKTEVLEAIAGSPWKKLGINTNTVYSRPTTEINRLYLIFYVFYKLIFTYLLTGVPKVVNVKIIHTKTHLQKDFTLKIGNVYKQHNCKKGFPKITFYKKVFLGLLNFKDHWYMVYNVAQEKGFVWERFRILDIFSSPRLFY